MCDTFYSFYYSVSYRYIFFWEKNRERNFYFQEIDMNVQVVRDDDDVKILLSKDNDFGTDYITAPHHKEVIMYYIPPHTIYVDGASTVTQKKFNIIEHELDYTKIKEQMTCEQVDSIENSDSILIKDKSYILFMNLNFSIFSVYDYSNGDSIYFGCIWEGRFG